MADNTITLVGNLTRDPELRVTTGGKGVASFGIAVGRRYQVNGEWQEQTSYFNIVAWGQMGENAAAIGAKVDPFETGAIAVERNGSSGRIQARREVAGDDGSRYQRESCEG